MAPSPWTNDVGLRVPFGSDTETTAECQADASTSTSDFEDEISGTRRHRTPMNQEDFDAKHMHKPGKSEMKRRLKKTGMRYVHPFSSCAAFKRAFFGFVPILDWLPKYAFKSSIILDLLGGITVGVMNVPQGIAYAELAGLPAVCGLYVCFFCPLFYTLFGTSRHNSISAFSIVCLMCGLAVERFTDPTSPKYNTTVAFIDDPAKLPTPEQVACSLTMLVSFINIAMALLRLEFLATYLSDQVVSAFTTAATVHVLVSQIPDALGITGVVKHDGENGNLIKNIYEIAVRIPDANLYTCGISLFCIAFLLIGKEGVSVLLLRCCNFQYALPYELLLIIITTVCSACFHLDQDPFDVKIIGNITTGYPIPTVPRFDLMMSLIPDAITITLVTYALHISLGRTFAKNYGYELDDNQELIALGITAAASSFFPVHPPACSLSRSLINSKIGTKTALSNVFAASLVLATILFLDTYLEPLPKPVLSCIVLVALYGVLLKFKELVVLWPVSKIDFSIWVVSFLSTALIDIVPGLIISVGYALFTTIAREQWPRWHILGHFDDDEVDFDEADRYENYAFYQGICVFRFDSPLLFTNVHRFKKSVGKAIAQWEKDQFVLRVEKKPNGSQKEIFKEDTPHSRYLIIDCSGFTFVDFMGVTALKETFLDMQKSGVSVYFAAAKMPVRDLFAQCGFHDQVPKSNFCLKIEDAVAIATERSAITMIEQKLLSERTSSTDIVDM